MAEHGIPIEVKELYKIFGTNPGAYIDAVKQGMTKAELNEKHGHVLGLRDNAEQQRAVLDRWEISERAWAVPGPSRSKAPNRTTTE